MPKIFRRRSTRRKVLVLLLITTILLILKLPQLYETSNRSNTVTSAMFVPPLTELEEYLCQGGIDFNIPRRFNLSKINKPAEPSETEIPKSLHFIWNDEYIPAMFADNLKSFRFNNPTWNIVFWTLGTARDLISDKEPQLMSTFTGHKMAVVKADVIKYVVLFYYGGAYFDLDTKCIKPLDPFLQGKQCVISAEGKENAIVHLQIGSLLASSVFLCRARHPLFRHLIDRLPFYRDERNILAAAGPLFVTWNVATFIRRRLRDKLYDRSSFEVVSSEHFEDEISEPIQVRFAKLCAKASYIGNGNLSQNINPVYYNGALEYWNKGLYLDPVLWIKIVQSACVNWKSRGGLIRKPSPNAITEHAHYGTYLEKNQKRISSSKKLHIKAIIPDVKIFS